MNDYLDYLQHSTGAWKNHKYIKKIGDTYVYAKDKASAKIISSKTTTTKSEFVKNNFVTDKASMAAKREAKKANAKQQIQNMKEANALIEKDSAAVTETLSKLDEKVMAKIKKQCPNLYAVSEGSADPKVMAKAANEVKKAASIANNATSLTEISSDMKNKIGLTSPTQGSMEKSALENYKFTDDQVKELEDDLKKAAELLEIQKSIDYANKYLMNDAFDDPNQLAHHGILGQKHGVQNGPPYPLSRSSLSAKEKKENPKPTNDTQKQEAKQSNNNSSQNSSTIKKEVKTLAKAQDVYAARTNVSDKELQDYLKRVNLEKQLKDLADKEYEAEHPVKTFIKGVAKDTAKAAEDAVKSKAQSSVKSVISELYDKEMAEMFKKPEQEE